MTPHEKLDKAIGKASNAQLRGALRALMQVSFYARINHGTKCKDYGEVVDPALKDLGLPEGEL